MAELGYDFDPNSVPEDDRTFEPMPAGDYEMQVIESDVITTKSGGKMIKLTLEVVSGPFERRKVWENINIQNQNPDAERIGVRALADLTLAVGLVNVRNSEDLHFRPFRARLKIEPAKDGYDAKNKVSRYMAMNGSAPAPQQRQAAPQQSSQPRQQAAAGGSSRPWARAS